MGDMIYSFRMEVSMFFGELNFKIKDDVERSIEISTERDSYTISIRDGKSCLLSTYCDEPHLLLRIKESHLKTLIEGRAEILNLYMQGRIKAGGNMALFLAFFMAVGVYQEEIAKSDKIDEKAIFTADGTGIA